MVHLKFTFFISISCQRYDYGSHDVIHVPGKIRLIPQPATFYILVLFSF
jgi:hypothetical protein